jgi:hypothetical protein
MDTLYAAEVARVIERLKSQAPADLAPVAYWHDGPDWAGFLRDTLPATPVTDQDAAYLLRVLVADMRAHLAAGHAPTPELEARAWLLMGGLPAYLDNCRATHRLPDGRLLLLLLRPDLLPENFVMYTTKDACHANDLPVR